MCGLAGASSVMVMVPVRAFGVVGVNVTVMVQLAPAATVEPQLLVWAKSPLLVMLVMLRVRKPVFVSVTVCAALVDLTSCVPKARLVADRVTAGPVPTPTPVRERVCGLLGASSVMLTFAVRVPVVEGVNFTETVQLLWGATLLPTQVLV